MSLKVVCESEPSRVGMNLYNDARATSATPHSPLSDHAQLTCPRTASSWHRMLLIHCSRLPSYSTPRS